MSHLLWKYFWENDVENFRRLLDPNGSDTQHLSKSPAVAHGNFGLSFHTPGGSPKSGPRSHRVSGHAGASGRWKESATPLGRHEVNSRDHAGTTILLRAAGSMAPSSTIFVQSLLEHPAIDVHIQDQENGWNALHRALYAGNITIARLLLHKERQDMLSHNTSLAGRVGQLIKTKDNEGNSPFDLYNSTIGMRSFKLDESSTDTNSELDEFESLGEKAYIYRATQASHKLQMLSNGDELFVFGSNKNLSLGVGDQDDRQFPERIQLRRPDHLVHRFHQSYLDDNHMTSDYLLPSWEEVPNMIRSRPLVIADVVMSKLHSAVLTTDLMSNLYVCGVGRGGRLGLGDENTQFKYMPVLGPLADKHVQQIALGQNHTLAVTSNGELWTWGMNTESQLGYVLPPPLKVEEEPMSLIPRQVFGTLKKEIVLGVAASAKHSVCHTGSSLYCWGQNLGQLALMDADSRSLDVQVIPRRVAASLLSAPIEMVSAVERATVVLLANHSVWIFANYGYNLVKFPIPDVFSNQGLATSSNPYDPKRRDIRYIASGGQTIAAITSRGDLFTMDLNKDDSNQAAGSTTNPVKIKGAVTVPHCIWDSRKDGVVSVDVGENGSVIICTESGAVWRRVKRAKGKHAAFTNVSSAKKKDFKFERIPYITNCVSVRSSVFGAFALLRKDIKAMTTATDVSQQNLWDHLAPLLSLTDFAASEDGGGADMAQKTWNSALLRASSHPVCLELMRTGDIERDLQEWLKFSSRTKESDLLMCTASGPAIQIPVHSWVLAGRSSVLRTTFSDVRNKRSTTLPEGASLWSTDGQLVLSLEVDMYTLLNIIVFSYLDTIIPVWKYTKETPALAYRFRQVRSEVMKYATRLRMPKLETAARLQNDVERSLDMDLREAMGEQNFLESGDVLLQLDGEEIIAHSQLLYQRCPFFEGMFFGRSQGQWLSARRDAAEQNERIEIDLKHISPETFQFVMTYLYADTGTELFDEIAKASLEDFCDLVVDVMAAANELMLDRLSEVCQHLIGKFVNARNISNLLNEISPCSVTTFRDAGMEYICLQLEMMLENHLLDSLDEDLLQDLEHVVRDNQLTQLPIAKGGNLELAMCQTYPNLAFDIKEERERRVREMAFKSNQRDEERKSSSSYKARFGSYEESPSVNTPTRNRRKSRGNRNEPFSPLLRPRTSHADLIFNMEDEHTFGEGSLQSPGLDAAASGLAEVTRKLSLGQSQSSPAADRKGVAASSTPTRQQVHTETVPTDRSSPAPGSAPWAATPLQIDKLDLRNIMSEASSQSTLSARLASEGKRDSRISRAAGTKMSQKEKKKHMLVQSEALNAAEFEQANQTAWETIGTGNKLAPWKSIQSSLPTPSLKETMSAETKNTPKKTTRNTSKNTTGTPVLDPPMRSGASPDTTQRRTASPDTRFSGQRRVQSSSAVPSASQQQQQSRKPIAPHSKSYVQPKPKAEPTLGYSMTDIMGQQEREQELVKEAIAKRSLQEIQEEQAFQEWWDQESRRTQDEEAKRRDKHSSKGEKDGKSSKRGRGGRLKGTMRSGNVDTTKGEIPAKRESTGDKGGESNSNKNGNNNHQRNKRGVPAIKSGGTTRGQGREQGSSRLN